MTEPVEIGLLGFGEVGQIIGACVTGDTNKIKAYDIRFSDTASSPFLAAESSPRIKVMHSAAELAAHSAIVFSAVTAEQTESACASIADHIQVGTWFVDLNSASPAAKTASANRINHNGGLYVEVSVMSPVPPKQLGTPNTKVYSELYGQASAAKMCRSVLVKGVEALLLESLVAARTYGVERTVLSSLDDLFPGPNWPELARYMIGRTLEHGGRRAEEMREVAKTVSGAHLTPSMSLATAQVQDWAKHHPHVQEQIALDDVLDALRNIASRTNEGSQA